ncbi:MarR family transcriptional regulator [Microbacterium sp.]|uniref:MarR family winged helix-turn-helix transcriptional regulator n=1 Tax=Microbacterium sp. TaxID=51671 RepID=UPI00322157BB
MSGHETSDAADAIAAALAQLRGARRLPPWAEGGPDGPPGWGPRGHGHGPHHHGPPWAGARLGGPARMRLLEVLAAAPSPLSVSELADEIGVDQPRASRLVQQSVELGLVQREADPTDARRTRIVLTAEGERLIGGFRGRRRGAVEQALADFSDAERAELARLLPLLADILGG